MATSRNAKISTVPEGGVQWKISPKQNVLFNWWRTSWGKRSNGIIADGAIRSGKSLACSMSFIMWATETFRGKAFAFCGFTVEACVRNVLNPLMENMSYMNLSCSWMPSKNLLIIMGEGGVYNYFYVFGGHDAKSEGTIRGITLAGVYLDEVTLMPESFVNQALGRCSVDGSKYFITTNPDSPTHWFKRDVIDRRDERKLVYQHFFLTDNWSLSDEIVAKYEAQFTGLYYRRFIKGEWCQADGLVYAGFGDSMIVDLSDMGDYTDFLVGIDYGTQNPTAFVMVAYNFRLGCFEIVKEYYYDGRTSQNPKTDAEYVQDFTRFIDGFPVMCAFIDPSAASLYTALRNASLCRIRQADNEVLKGIYFTSSLISLGKLVACRGCTNTINEFRTYAWDTEKSRKYGEDIVLKVSDHAMDALRYVAATHIMPRLKSYGIEMASPEKMNRQVGDEESQEETA